MFTYSKHSSAAATELSKETVNTEAKETQMSVPSGGPKRTEKRELWSLKESGKERLGDCV